MLRNGLLGVFGHFFECPKVQFHRSRWYSPLHSRLFRGSITDRDVTVWCLADMCPIGSISLENPD